MPASRAGRRHGSATDSAAQVLLPPGFSPDTSAESVTSIGSSQANAGFFGPNGPGISPSASATASAAATAPSSARRDRTVLAGAAGRADSRADAAGPAAGFGGPFGGRGGRGNQIRGTVFQSIDSSVLDTAPFALNGQPTMKPDYFQQRFGATLGGPLVIPARRQQPAHVLLRQLHRQPFAQSVRRVLDRADARRARRRSVGDRAQRIVDPLTGQPFVEQPDPCVAARSGDAEAARADSRAEPGRRSRRTSTRCRRRRAISTTSTSGSCRRSARCRSGAAAAAADAAAAAAVAAAGRRPRRRVEPERQHPLPALRQHAARIRFPSLGGTSTSSAWDIPVSYSFTKAGLTHALRARLQPPARRDDEPVRGQR